MTANEAASEKLSTDMMDMTVDAKHKFMDLRTIHNGATPSDDLGIFNATRGINEIKPKMIGDRICIPWVSAMNY